jgi:rare lipoprotein A
MNKIMLAVPVFLICGHFINPAEASSAHRQVHKAIKTAVTKTRKADSDHQRTMASWYGSEFHGKKTASGQTYDMFAMTAAHKSLPLLSYAKVTNPKNHRSVVVRINDRGSFHGKRGMDLSYAAAKELGIHGLGSVEVTPLSRNEALLSMNTAGKKNSKRS